MEVTLEVVVFLALLFDSIGANIASWLGDDKWYKKHFRLISRYFPLTKGWTTWYLIITLWIGVMLFRAGAFSS